MWLLGANHKITVKPLENNVHLYFQCYLNYGKSHGPHGEECFLRFRRLLEVDTMFALINRTICHAVSPDSGRNMETGKLFLFSFLYGSK